ncbi:penicillin-binding protein 2 [bacterium]|nr:penicillin-binding protein 2 [bacterium]
MMNHNSALKRSKRNIRVSLVIASILTCLLLVRLFYVAFLDQKVQSTISWVNPVIMKDILPMRGEIRSADNVLYAQCREAFLFWVNPTKLQAPKVFSALIHDYIQEDTASILKRIQDHKFVNKEANQYYILKQKIDREQKQKIEQILANTDGYTADVDYGFEDDLKRTYPQKNVLSNLLGVVGDENYGLGGIEKWLDSELRGFPGKKREFHAFINDQMPGTSDLLRVPQNGNHITLTIHHYLQTKVESVLEYQCQLWGATGATCIVMKPGTGEILSMATVPTYDLNLGSKYINDPKYKNQALRLNYEPGSIFKPITTSMALEEKMIEENTIHECNGSYSIGGIRIECIIAHGKQNLSGILRNSCNVALAKVGTLLGKTFYQYALRFNFGKPLPGLPIEQEKGILPPTEEWYDSTVATMAFGQGLSVTPIQMVCAYSAIANDGIMMKPILVKQIRNAEGQIIQDFKPEAIRQVLSRKVALKMKSVLKDVVADPDSIANAYIEGMSIGGKTGTAKQVVNGRYDDSSLICSFIGFFPAEKPEYVVLVSIIEPENWKGDQEAFGSSVAAPAFREIAHWIKMNPGLALETSP